MRIFVVENDPDSRELLSALLEKLGHTVFSAETMGGALAALPKADCDVLISDLGLSDGDGWELLRRLELPHWVYAIALSGYGTSSDRARSKAAGYRHHLVKPSSPEELEAALRNAAKVLDSRKSVRAHGPKA